MTYLIKVKGDQEIMDVEDTRGARLLSAWQDYQRDKKRNNPIEINGWHGMVSDIRSIKYSPDVSAKKNTDLGDYIKEHAQIRKLTAKEKALRFGFVKLFHYTMTGKRLEDESMDFKKQVAELQLKFFTENPTRIHPDPIIFKGLYGDDKYNQTGFRVIQNVVRRDHSQQQWITA